MEIDSNGIANLESMSFVESDRLEKHYNPKDHHYHTDHESEHLSLPEAP